MENSVDQNLPAQYDASTEPLTRDRRCCHNSTSPIHSLPNELLALIFDFGVRMEAEGSFHGKGPKETLYVPLAIGAYSEATEGAENRVVDDRSDSDDEDAEEDSALGSKLNQDCSSNYQGIQMLASHVCSRWRECSLSIPTLWSHINLSEGPPYAKTQEWLIRSKRAPLEIDLDFTHPGQDLHNPMEGIFWKRGIVAEALNVIIPHISRWKGLVFHGEHSRLVQLLLQELEDKEASILETVVLKSANELVIPGYWTLRPVKLFASPRLRRLSLHAMHLDWSGPNLGGTNLTSLILEDQDNIRQPTILEFVAMLESSPNLEELALKSSGPSSQPEWTVIGGGYGRGPPIHTNLHIKVQPVLLPRLEQLSLSSLEDMARTNRIIELIQAPALLHLTLKDIRPCEEELDLTDTIWVITSNVDISQHTPWEEVQLALLSPRFPRLEELTIERLSCRFVVAYWCMFHTFRSLKRLHIVIYGHIPFEPFTQGSVLHCFLDPSLTTYPISEEGKERHRWLDQEFGTPCPLLEEFQCSGVHATTLTALARRRNKIGRRLRTMRFHVRDGFTEAELDGLYSLVDNLVECETPYDWEEVETPSGSDDSGVSEMDDDRRHDSHVSGRESDEHEGVGDTCESGDSE